ncbi:metallophosphatase [Mucilaginibacter xinganensis]|uniref:Metallophosphatase n=2 Tax=Mucilaginibacter xinganensis TaxID=1234841 RepID=A0A223NSL7_9SPHI|nr:metallophosphoesterase [Mucilaginibacter xinganensis]ASU32816.1 metallophosphatase [Mucilaginibacter xinganensis]
MKGQTLHVIFLILALLLIDLYVLSGLRGLSGKWKFLQKVSFKRWYWMVSVLLIAGLIFVVFVKMGLVVRLAVVMAFFVVFLFKISYLPFLFTDDVRRWIISYKKRLKSQHAAIQQPLAAIPGAIPPIPRSEFLMKAGLLAGAIPLAALKLEMKSGLYDYHIRHQTLYFPDLPKAFDGIRLGQISDIHSGSFFDKKAVLGGVEMLMREKADFIFFTGDLVNAVTEEVKDYQDIFSKVKAPLGVYSCLGNHDYGDYSWWPDEKAKRKNFEEIIAVHKRMGWDLLMNENRRLKVDGEEIGILGIENWGELSRFPKYGRMDLAVKNTDDLPVKLLLSHDPSHWRAQVLPEYPQIDAMFSGHTHGMQMGVRTANFQWSPIQYIYNEWAGHYQQGKQQLYVNVGYGFLGFSGRVGILPEITIFELKTGTNPSKKFKTA